ncbi:hypothetical protein SLEP1_g28796 [Rubroshorea leprosula]|uniref:Uncharacterized protein n=1 Tax=Rubroshorea leprosula TaxID=152421 RepID=A0AAV5K3G1_9ROSI|nr:hypothetical protein SLEP1_g28796 [Rubroshorea leprosula]
MWFGNEPYLLVVGEWENRVIMGRLSNLRKAPKELPFGFRFRAALHHEVADSAPLISGYKKLEEMVRSYHIPKTILLRACTQNERACTVSQTGWILVLRAGSDVADAQQHKVHHRLYAVVCEVGDTSQGDSVQVTVPIINNDLTARLSKWCVPNTHVNYPQLLPRDTDLKNQLLEYAKRENLIDLEALATSEQLAMFRFVDVANQFTEAILLSYTMNSSRVESYIFVCAGEMSSILERQCQGAQGSRGRTAGSASQRQTRFDERPPPAPQSRSSSHRGSNLASKPRAEHRAKAVAPVARRRSREDTDSEDEVPLIRRRTSLATQPAQAIQIAAARSPSVPSAMAQAAAEPTSASTSMLAPRIAYPIGFSYVKTNCQPAMVQGKQSFVPPVDRQQARTYVQQHGEQVAMIKLMDAFSYVVTLFESEQGARTQNNELSASCKQLAVEKASLVDDVNHLQGSEMATRAASAESRVEELMSKNNELKEELERAHAEKESDIQAPVSRGRMVGGLSRVPRRCGGGVCKHDHGNLQRDLWKSAAASPGLPNTLRRRGGSRGPASFDVWVEGALVAEPEPSNTPPPSQPAVVPAGSPVTALAHQPVARPFSSCLKPSC